MMLSYSIAVIAIAIVDSNPLFKSLDVIVIVIAIGCLTI